MEALIDVEKENPGLRTAKYDLICCEKDESVSNKYVLGPSPLKNYYWKCEKTDLV